MTEQEKAEAARGQALYQWLLPHQDELLRILNQFLASYCKCFKQLSLQTLYLEEAAWFVEIETLRGQYRPRSKHIYINIATCPIAKLFALIHDVYNNNLAGLQRDDVYALLFGTRVGSIGVMLHEIEHAHRYTDDNMHGPGMDADGNEGVSFNACAASWASKVIAEGLHNLWAQDFRTSVKDLKIFESWQSIVNIIEQLESINRDKLVDFFDEKKE